MNFINNSGITVYLKTDSELLLERLKSEAEKRPLLRGRSEAELLVFINEKIAERAVFYEQADIIIEQKSNEQNVPQEILEAIMDKHKLRIKN